MIATGGGNGPGPLLAERISPVLIRHAARTVCIVADAETDARTAMELRDIARRLKDIAEASAGDRLGRDHGQPPKT